MLQVPFTLVVLSLEKKMSDGFSKQEYQEYKQMKLNTLGEPMFRTGEPLLSTSCAVNHPNHYTQGTIEVIDFILDQDFNYLEGNIIKYVSRYTRKNGLEDLKKAKWYLDKLIEETQGNG